MNKRGFQRLKFCVVRKGLTSQKPMKWSIKKYFVIKFLTNIWWAAFFLQWLYLPFYDLWRKYLLINCLWIWHYFVLLKNININWPTLIQPSHPCQLFVRLLNLYVLTFLYIFHHQPTLRFLFLNVSDKKSIFYNPFFLFKKKTENFSNWWTIAV